MADIQEPVYGPIIGRTVQDVIVVHIKKWLQYRMMNAPVEPTKSSQRLSGPYILTPSAPNYKSNFSQVRVIHYNLSTIIYRSGFQMLLTLQWQ